MSLSKLVEISNYYGKNHEYVLGGGGNTSYKDDKYLYVKGSGTTLADIKEDGFVKMNRAALADIWKKEYSANNEEREAQVLADLMDAREKSEYAKRPSVETSLHDLLPQSYVVHLHPALVNGMTCGKNGEAEARAIFPEAIWIPLIMPGYTLAKKVKEELEAYKSKNGKDAEILFLENHGVFVASDSIDRIKELYCDIDSRLSAKLIKALDFSEISFDMNKAAAIAPAIRMLLKGDSETSIVTFRTNKEISALVASKDAFLPASSGYTPDHVVYCKAEPLFVESSFDIEKQYELLEKSIKEYNLKFGFMPRIIAVEGLGIFAQGETKKNTDIIADVFMDTVKISVYSQSFGGYKFMPQAMLDFIASWEVESYRAKISLASKSKKRLNEKISIVTGSAQGFGKGIAEEMLNEGASVVISDLNYDLAVTNAKALEEEFGKGKTLAVRVDVGDEDSVSQMLVQTVLEFGGLDIFVNNAGIVKAGSLDELDTKSFDLVTKINYTAYFLGAKYASKIMKIQNRFDKKYYMDIIQINSKSGLTGSNKNFAYAGSKFGGIGLTQSFALELIENNIKVNSICPGNFFDGPLWSDPVNGLFVQYLNSGKIPGAKTVEDVKRAYESKIPMDRGCTVIDVARAVFYCVEQKYETGQAIPVTGGQSMLK